MRKIDKRTEKIFRVVVTVERINGSKLEIVKKIKDCPTAEQMANLTILLKISGFPTQKAMPEAASPRTPAITTAVKHMKRLVQNMKSYDFGLTPTEAVSVFRRF